MHDKASHGARCVTCYWAGAGAGAGAALPPGAGAALPPAAAAAAAAPHGPRPRCLPAGLLLLQAKKENQTPYLQ